MNTTNFSEFVALNLSNLIQQGLVTVERTGAELEAKKLVGNFSFEAERWLDMELSSATQRDVLYAWDDLTSQDVEYLYLLLDAPEDDWQQWISMAVDAVTKQTSGLTISDERQLKLLLTLSAAHDYELNLVNSPAHWRSTEVLRTEAAARYFLLKGLADEIIASSKAQLNTEAAGTAPGEVVQAARRMQRTKHKAMQARASYEGKQEHSSLLIKERPALNEEVVSENRSRFTIAPLEPGFGYTLGNSLRRILLSSIPGSAVSSIRILGLTDLTRTRGIQEDVTEIILNIQNLSVSSEHEEPIVAYLRKQGPGVVTAGDITSPAGVKFHNPEMRIATLNSTERFELELTIERGRGHASAAHKKAADTRIDRIPIDSIYSPVVKVSFRVEPTRVEQHIDFDKLIVDVETKQAMAPRDAIASAGNVLLELFGLTREQKNRS